MLAENQLKEITWQLGKHDNWAIKRWLPDFHVNQCMKLMLN